MLAELYKYQNAATQVTFNGYTLVIEIGQEITSFTSYKYGNWHAFSNLSFYILHAKHKRHIKCVLAFGVYYTH